MIISKFQRGIKKKKYEEKQYDETKLYKRKK